MESTIIKELETNIKTLQKMKDMYDKDVNLYGMFASDMNNEIDEQIEFCQVNINNLKTI